MKRSLFLFLLCAFFTQAVAQNPTKWTFTANHTGGDTYDLILSATIDDGWSTYSQTLESDDGPVPTSIEFKPGSHFELIGKAKESGEIHTVDDPVFEMKLTKFKHKAIFTQKAKVTDTSKPIEGYINFMVCNDEMCLPPKDVDFSFSPKPKAAAATPKPEVKATTPNTKPAVPTNTDSKSAK